MATAFVLLNVDLGKENEVWDRVSKVKGVEEAYRVYGVYDQVVKVKAETQDKLKSVVWEIRQLPGLRSSLTMIAVE